MRATALLLPLLLLAAALPAAPRMERNQIVPEAAFAFVGDTAELAPGSTAAVQELAAYLAAKTHFTRVRIEGHVAAPAGAAAQELSEQRALAVARALVAAGVDCARVLAVGFGDSKPVAAPRSAPANTRIEIHGAALRGRLIGGLPEDGGGRPAGDPCGR